MAIDANCPYCEKGYRLKDDLVGKKVTCANQACRKVFTVTPSANGFHPPAPAASAPRPAPPKMTPPADAEDVAAAALNDDPNEVPEDQKTITMKCTMCDHPWPVAWAMQGKNVLCPDCKHRQKVPLQEQGKKGGWREQNAPEGVKQEKLEGVVGTRDTKMVSGETLRKTGVIQENFDPRPTAFWVKWVAIVGIPLLLVAGGVVYKLKSRKEQAATQEIVNFDKALEADELKDLPLYQAALRISLGEYEARKPNDPAARNKAIEYFRGALANLALGPRTPDREQLYGELAVALLNLGGDGPALIDKFKLSWLPPQQNTAGKVQVTPNPAELEGVQGQLRRVLSGLKDTRADFDVRAALLRRLGRELLKVNQLDVVRSNVIALFDAAEQPEAEAQLGLECLRANKPELAKEIGEKLKKGLTTPPPLPPPASLQALWILSEIKGPSLVPSPAGGGEISEATRWAYAAVALVKKNAADLDAILKRDGKADAKLRVLALAAEWSDAPADVLRQAEAVVKAPRDVNTSLPEGALLRLAQTSARTGTPERAEEFVKPIYNDALKAYARSEVLRNKLAAEPTAQPKDDEAEVPEGDPKKLRLGHAWGRLHLARHNARRTGDRGLANVYDRSWPPKTIAPFGHVGVLLGVQDAERK